MTDSSVAASGRLSDWRVRHQASLDEARYNTRIFFKDKLAVLGLAIIIVTISMAILAPWLAPYPQQGRGASNLKERFEAPSSHHLMGTDNLGRDILSRIVYGARIPLLISFTVTAVIVVIGVPLGGVAGYYGGRIDEVVMRITDVFLAFPSLVLAITFVAFLGPSIRNVMIAIVVSWWPWYTRLVRGVSVSLRERPYVEAARTMGVRDSLIIFRHILPNAFGPVIVQMTLDIGTVILAAAALSFVGLGAQAPTAEWGLMISEGRQYILDYWWIGSFAGLAIFILVLAFNFVGDGLRDVLDPKSKR
jgi:peptide/nickel transport system permease protein